MPPHKSPLLGLPSETLDEILSYLFPFVKQQVITFRDNCDITPFDFHVKVLRVSHAIHHQAVHHLRKALRSSKLYFHDFLPFDSDRQRRLFEAYGDCFEHVEIANFMQPYKTMGNCESLQENIDIFSNLKLLEFSGCLDATAAPLFLTKFKHSWEQWIDIGCESANQAIVQDLWNRASEADDDYDYDILREGYWDLMTADVDERDYQILMNVTHHLELSQGQYGVLVSDTDCECRRSLRKQALTISQNVWVDMEKRTVVGKEHRMSSQKVDAFWGSGLMLVNGQLRFKQIGKGLSNATS